MTETRKKDKKGKKKGNKRGQRERDREPAAGKRKPPSNLFYFVLHIKFFFFLPRGPETYFSFIKKKRFLRVAKVRIPLACQSSLSHGSDF